MNQEFKISIVVAIYNMQDYLEEAIESVVQQTIGFEDNIQLILVNDGSIDESEKICKRYEVKYPNNIIYIYKENSGVSDARNCGLELACGELINFLDADDKLALDATEKVYLFYASKQEEVDLISIPIVYFEGREDEHLLNFKFSDSRVINIFREPECLHLHISSSFLKREEIKKYRFDSRLHYGEDAVIANKMILNKGAYGVVSNTKYMYRQRITGDSAIQEARRNQKNYIPPLKYFHLELIDFVKERYLNIPEYMQRLLIYDLTWKIRVPSVTKNVLDEAEIEEFLNYAKEIVSFVEDKIILEAPRLRGYYNLYLLKLKYQELSKDKFQLIQSKDDAALCLGDRIVDMLYRQTINIDGVEICEGNIQISGGFACIFDLYDIKLILEHNGKEVAVTYEKSSRYEITSLNQFVSNGYQFKVKIALNEIKNVLKFKLQIGKSKTQVQVVYEDSPLDIKQQVITQMNEYRVICVGKSLIIEKDIEAENEKSNDCIIVSGSEKKKSSDKEKLYRYIGEKAFQISFSNIGMLFIKNSKYKKIINRLTKTVPNHYKNYLLSVLENSLDFEKNIAFTRNQACIYNKDFELLSKITDISIDVKKFLIKDGLLNIELGVISPFLSKDLHLICYIDGQAIECKRKENKKLIGIGKASILERDTFETTVLAEKLGKIYFQIQIECCHIIPGITFDELKWNKEIDRAGYTVDIIDKKQFELKQKG